MKIELEVSNKNEFTESPYWLILDPCPNQLGETCDSLANKITGPFFSREEAENYLQNRRYAFGKRAVVYCLSGCYARQYREAYRKAEKA